MKATYLVLAVAIAALQTTTPPKGAQPISPSSAPCKCSLEVTVQRLGTGEPIADAEVSITPLLTTTSAPGIEAYLTSQAEARSGIRSAKAVTVVTDNSGRAVFRDVSSGDYSVQAQTEGYFGKINDTYTTETTARVSVQPADKIDTLGTAPQDVKRVTLTMVQGATITGRVLNGNGRPASGLPVGAFSARYQDGHRILDQTISAVSTDDHGEFRLYWFPPGEYHIRTGLNVTAQNTYPNPFYYPGTVDPNSAIPVTIREGDNRTGIDINLKPPVGVTISGTIISTVPGFGTETPLRLGVPGLLLNRPVTSAYLVPRNSSFFEMPATIRIGSEQSGSAKTTPADAANIPFEIHGVPPGTYDFYPIYNATSATSGVQSGTFAGRTVIEVGTENVTGIQSIIRPGTNLEGHVTITDAPPHSASSRPSQPLTPTKIRVRVQARDNIPRQAMVSLRSILTLDNDRNFKALNLPEGQYFISEIQSLSGDAYVSDIRQDARSVFEDGMITIGKESTSQLEVIVSRGGGTIQGVVQDAKHNPAGSVQITLIPDGPRRQNPLLYKVATSTPRGRFDLSGIAPGNYKLFAWERNPATAVHDPEFIREYDALGVSVNVGPGLPLANIQVPLIPAKH